MYESDKLEESAGYSSGRKGATPQQYTPWMFENAALDNTKRLMELPPCTFGQPVIDYMN